MFSNIFIPQKIRLFYSNMVGTAFQPGSSLVSEQSSDSQITNSTNISTLQFPILNFKGILKSTILSAEHLENQSEKKVTIEDIINNAEGNGLYKILMKIPKKVYYYFSSHLIKNMYKRFNNI